MRLTFCYLHISPYHHAQLNAVASLGADVTVISFEHFMGAAFAGQNGEPKKYLKLVMPSGGEVRKKLYRMLETSNPEVIIVPGWGHAYALAALQWSIRNNVPCVVISDSQERDYSRNPITESVKAKLAKMFSAGFVAGKRSQEYLAKLGMPVERITVGCNVVDNDHFICGTEKARADKSARMLLGLPLKYFLVVNRLVSEKNVSTIIKAYASYCCKGAPGNWKLVIVGDGPLINELKALVDSLQIENMVIFKGAVSYRDIPEYYGLATAFILASRLEPWGLVINEAMCSGLPILVSDSCGSSVDLIQNGKNGFSFHCNDVDVLTKLMVAIASGHFDISSMGDCSRDIISEWSLDRYVTNLNKTIEIALNVRPPNYNFFDRVYLELATHWLIRRQFNR